MREGENEITRAAIAAIGPVGPSDYVLAPRTHAASFKDPAKVAPLLRVLAAPDLQQTVDAYEAADRSAVAAQRRYKRAGRIAATTSFLAIALAAVALLPRAGVIDDSFVSAAFGLQIACLVLSLAASLWLGWRRPFQAWMRQRAEAETARVTLFRKVTEAAAPADPAEDELPLLPLQLEYFRRFLLDEQRLYYEKRAADHARAVRRRMIWRGIALQLILAAAVPVVWTFQGKDWIPAAIVPYLAVLPPKTELAQRLFLCLGLIGGALQGLLAANALLSHDERNAMRYRETWQNLEHLATRPLDEARNAAVLGQRDRVLAFVALCLDQISSEHRDWVSLRSVAPELSLDRLRERALPRLG